MEQVNQNNEKDLKKLKKRIALYNTVPNLLWSAINLTPISVFCYTLMNAKMFYTFLAISLLSIFLPRSFFDKMQLGKSGFIYKKLGVPLINRVVQNGDIINNLIRKKYPEHKMLGFQRSSAKRLLQQTYMFEKFHFMMFLFFSLATFYAIFQKYFGWAVLLSVCNVAYNIYPNLLQQYIRLRIRAHAKRESRQ